MKIGILTQPLKYNYGGLLQNYALQKVLVDAGHEVETLDHVNYGKFNTTLYVKVIELIRYLLGMIGCRRYQLSTREQEIIYANTNSFIEKYIKRTKILKSENDFIRLGRTGGYDAFVVGSDQCWRPYYNGNAIQDMYCSFVPKCKNVKRVAYAASFGTDVWEYSKEMARRFAPLAKDFDFISLREDSGVQLCKEYLGVDATHVLDPTMLLTKDDYIKLIEAEKEPDAEDTLFNYILDPDAKKTAFINKVAEGLNLIPFQVLPKYQAETRTKDVVKQNIEDCVYPGVTTWLRAFMDSKMVIVDSFHGMVFSIIFNKPFWIIGNRDRGLSRFTSLLKQFNLEERLLEVDNIDDIDYTCSIDWSQVNIKLQRLRLESKSLLLNALK